MVLNRGDYLVAMCDTNFFTKYKKYKIVELVLTLNNTIVYRVLCDSGDAFHVSEENLLQDSYYKFVDLKEFRIMKIKEIFDE